MTETAERQPYNAGRGVRYEEQFAEEFAWAKQHLPAEHPAFVVTAITQLKLARQKPSTKTVMARLEATGRAALQREKG
jgi:hypothetical protein